jgi:hypothetical protein
MAAALGLGKNMCANYKDMIVSSIDAWNGVLDPDS